MVSLGILWIWKETTFHEYQQVLGCICSAGGRMMGHGCFHWKANPRDNYGVTANSQQHTQQLKELALSFLGKEPGQCLLQSTLHSLDPLASSKPWRSSRGEGGSLSYGNLLEEHHWRKRQPSLDAGRLEVTTVGAVQFPSSMIYPRFSPTIAHTYVAFGGWAGGVI